MAWNPLLSRSASLIATAGLVLTASTAADAAVDGTTGLTIADSSTFTYQYEMDVEPNGGADLDGNTEADFLPGSSGVDLNTSVTGATDGNTAIYNTDPDGEDDRSFALTGFDTIWDTLAPSAATGYTVETRLKVLTADGAEGSNGSIEFNAAASDDAASDAWLNIAANGQTWGFNIATVDLGTNDNTDDFHTFRIAYDATAGLFVWRDDVLLNPGGTPLVDAFDGATAYRLMLGSIQGTTDGIVEADYLRITSGAFAPVPEPGSALLVGGLATALLARRRARGSNA